MKEELYLRRTIPECMGMAWTLMTTNIRRMTTALWLPAVALALLAAVIVTLCRALQMDMASISPTSALLSVAVLILAALAAVAALILLDARVYKLLNEQPLAFCLRRAATIFGILLLLRIVGVVLLAAVLNISTLLAARGIVASTTALVIGLAALLVVLIALIVVCCPMLYVLMKYAIERVPLPTALRHYRVGLRHIGFILAFCLLCAIVMTIIYVIIALPNIIISTASTLSAAGSALGDAAGLPSYFLPLVALVTLITTLVAVALHVWSICAAYYMYASIEARTGRRDVREEDEQKEAL